VGIECRKEFKKVACAMPGITFWKHAAAMLCQDATSNHFGGTQDGGMSDSSSKGCTQRDDGSNIRWPLSCNRTGDDASKAVSDQMDPASGLGKRFLNGLIQLLPDQKVRTLCIEADT
jgi:hypothetical protein